MKPEPLVTIIMPTLNSEKTIRRSLESVRNQNFDQNVIEILVIDGGSTDSTREIAYSYQCKILDNEKIQPEHAKHIGLRYATSKYAFFLDSDEVLLNRNSFSEKIKYLENPSTISKNIITGGLKKPSGYGIMSDYVNCFGDPFSFFVYDIDGSDYLESLKKNHYPYTHHDDVVEFPVDPKKILPICDSGGHFFDLQYLKNNFDIKSVTIVPKIFSLMVSKTGSFAILKNDFINHYSVVNMSSYFKKIYFKVISNVFYEGNLGGFAHREDNMPLFYKIKKYLFVPFSFLVIPAIIYSFIKSIKYRKWYLLLWNPFIMLDVSICIVYCYFLKILGVKPNLRGYGQ